MDSLSNSEIESALMAAGRDPSKAVKLLRDFAVVEASAPVRRQGRPWQYHLRVEEGKGSFVTKDLALPISTDKWHDADHLFDEIKQIVDMDREKTKNWTNEATEDDSVYFKPDVNPNYGRYEGQNPRISPETRVSANFGADYIYSGKFHRGIPFRNSDLGIIIEKELLPRVEQWVAETWPHYPLSPPGPPTNALINYYENDRGHIGAHADKTDSNQNPTTDPVVMLSLGATRSWEVIPKPPGKEKKITVRVPHNQVAVMHEPMQQNYLHAMPKATTSARGDRPVGEYSTLDNKDTKERISITFRWLKPLTDRELADELAKEKAKREERLEWIREREQEEFERRLYADRYGYDFNEELPVEEETALEKWERFLDERAKRR